MEAGRILDPGDLVAAFARAISKQLDPQVADLGDTLDDCESELDAAQRLPAAHADRRGSARRRSPFAASSRPTATR